MRVLIYWIWLCAGILPFARELVSSGAQVVLAANESPSINDITAAELRDVVEAAAQLDPAINRAAQEQLLTVVSSGSDLPVIDLSEVISCRPAHFNCPAWLCVQM